MAAADKWAREKDDFRKDSGSFCGSRTEWVRRLLWGWWMLCGGRDVRARGGARQPPNGRRPRGPFGGGAPGGVFDGSPVLLPSRDANPRKPTIFPPQPVRTSVTRRAAITNRRNLRKIERRRIQSETLKFNETAKFSIWKTTKKRANLQVSYISTVRKLYLNASILLGFLRFLMAARRIMDVLSGKIVGPKGAA